MLHVTDSKGISTFLWDHGCILRIYALASDRKWQSSVTREPSFWSMLSISTCTSDWESNEAKTCAQQFQETVTKRSYPNNHLKREVCEVYRKLLDSKGARIQHKLQMHQTARHWQTGPSSLRISWIIEFDHGWTLQKVGWWRLKNWGRMRRILTVAPCSWYVSPNLFQPQTLMYDFSPSCPYAKQVWPICFSKREKTPKKCGQLSTRNWNWLTTHQWAQKKASKLFPHKSLISKKLLSISRLAGILGADLKLESHHQRSKKKTNRPSSRVMQAACFLREGWRPVFWSHRK